MLGKLVEEDCQLDCVRSLAFVESRELIIEGVVLRLNVVIDVLEIANSNRQVLIVVKVVIHRLLRYFLIRQ